jgi:hypothetical protein
MCGIATVVWCSGKGDCDLMRGVPHPSAACVLYCSTHFNYYFRHKSQASTLPVPIGKTICRSAEPRPVHHRTEKAAVFPAEINCFIMHSSMYGLRPIKALLFLAVFSSCGKEQLTWDLPQRPPEVVVKTDSVTGITPFSAVCAGSVLSFGAVEILEQGVCRSTTGSPTIDSTKAIDVSGQAQFEVQLNELAPSTIYGVRAYAIHSSGISYGDIIYFSTQEPGAITIPTVTTATVANITASGASSGGTVTSDGGSPVTARGVCWSNTPNPTTANNTTNDGSGTGSFSSLVNGLAASTTYYIRAYASNAQGTAYGSQLQFTTTAGATIPTVTTATVANITASGASSGGTVTSDGGSPVTARGVCWSNTPNPTTANNTTNDGSGTGFFLSTVSGLTPTTVYYIRAFATNSSGTAYGAQLQFTTSAPPPTLISTNNCNSLGGITTSYRLPNGNWVPWVINANGNPGQCLATTSDATAAWAEFTVTLPSAGYIEFWERTYQAGSMNRIPQILIDGVEQSQPTIIGGQQNSFFWMQLRSASIPSGTHSVRINYSQTGTYYNYYLDEISLFAY